MSNAESRSETKYDYEYRYINFSKDFKYYLSAYKTEHSVYKCHHNGSLELLHSEYAKKFLANKKKYERQRSKVKR